MLCTYSSLAKCKRNPHQLYQLCQIHERVFSSPGRVSPWWLGNISCDRCPHISKRDVHVAHRPRNHLHQVCISCFSAFYRLKPSYSFRRSLPQQLSSVLTTMASPSATTGVTVPAGGATEPALENTPGADDMAEPYRRSHVGSLWRRPLKWRRSLECHHVGMLLHSLPAPLANVIFPKDRYCGDTEELVRYYHWCNNVRKYIIGAEDAATEPVILGEKDVSRCLKEFTHQFFQNELTPEQRKEKRYVLRYDENNEVQLTTRQRSFMNNILRSKLGNKFVPIRIWTCGLPMILRLNVECPLPDMLQSSLEESLQWFGNLASDIVQRERRQLCRADAVGSRPWHRDRSKTARAATERSCRQTERKTFAAPSGHS